MLPDEPLGYQSFRGEQINQNSEFSLIKGKDEIEGSPLKDRYDNVDKEFEIENSPMKIVS